ncbi:MAG: hypothetical protein ACK4Y4_09250 [Brevundimonas sp.]
MSLPTHTVVLWGAALLSAIAYLGLTFRVFRKLRALHATGEVKLKPPNLFDVRESHRAPFYLLSVRVPVRHEKVWREVIAARIALCLTGVLFLVFFLS